MDIKEIRKLLDPQFGYWAKSTGELLYAHHFTVWSIFKKLSKYVPSLDEKEKYLLEIACLLHDIGKMKEEIQFALRKGKKLPYPHKLTSPQDIEFYLRKINGEVKLDKKDIEKLTDIIRTHHNVSEKDLSEINTSGVEFSTRLLRTADHIASMERISYDTIIKLKRIYENKLEFTVVEYSRFSSPTANLIVNKIVRHYKEKEWEPICFLENGIVFIGKISSSLPSKDDIVKDILSEIITQTIKRQSFQRRVDREQLVLLSKESPEKFLEIHKDSLKNVLNEIDRGFIFLKLWKEIASIVPMIGNRLNSSIFELLRLACGSSGKCKTEAKRKYKEIFNEIPPDKDILSFVFNKIKIKDIIPSISFLEININEDTLLRNLTAKELFMLLESLTQKVKEHKEGDVKKLLEELEKYLSSLLSMEEETDFEKIAKEIFEKYKVYKKISLAEKGCCERCGCPVAFKMQPTLNISEAYRKSQAFSQIKSKYAYRSICPFCAYDNFVLREGIKNKNKVKVFLRLQTKTSDLFVNHDEIKRLVNVILNGIKNPRNIIKFKEKGNLHNLPFPERIEIPVGKGDDNLERKMLITDNGLLIYLDDIKENEFSPKDMKAKYEPLYHIMQLLGFKVAIGTEEQEGLFGEKIETNEENYYKSLATVLLAKIHEKKQRKYIFARSLLEKSPSVTIRIIGESSENKKRTRLPEGLIKCLFKSLVKTKIVIARR